MDPYSLGLLTLDPDPYSKYGSGSRCSILPDIFFKSQIFLTKIHIFKLNFFLTRGKPNFISKSWLKYQKNGFKKYKKNVLQKITLKIRIRIWIQNNLRMLDPDPYPDPYIMYTDPKPCEERGVGIGEGVIKLQLSKLR